MTDIDTTEAYATGYRRAFDDMAERLAYIGARLAALDAREANIAARQAELDAKSAIFIYGRLIEAHAARRPYIPPTWKQQVAARIAESEAWVRGQGRDPHTPVPSFEQCMASWDEVAA